MWPRRCRRLLEREFAPHDPDVPLVIAEVNPDHLGLIDVQHDRGRDGFIVTNPNCSTIMLTLALEPLRTFGFSSVQVATMQAISGAGFNGVAAMDSITTSSRSS